MKIESSSIFYSFDKNIKPVLTVKSGDTVVISTKDCFSDQIQKPEDFACLNWDNINPATGPVFVEGAEPNDTLKVEILKINISDKGVMCVAPGAGALGENINAPRAKIFEIKDEMVLFNDKISIPVNKMIGVIGVAPEKEPVLNGTPGSHGGNMDNKEITEGAVLYLPVFHKGALFGLGDLHGAMGDGEIGVSGLEICGDVTVRLTVIDNFSIANPMLENSSDIYTIASAATLDEAVKISVKDMADFLSVKLPLDMDELVMLMSAAGHTEIAQVVDPLVTVRFRMPKSIIKGYFSGISG